VTASPKTLEKNLWRWLRAAVDRCCFAERVENLVGAGTPDVTLAWQPRNVVKVELKTCARPARDTTPLHVSVQPAQPGWHLRWARAGGLSVWLVQVGSGHQASRYALPGPLGGLLAAGGLTEASLRGLSEVVAAGPGTVVLERLLSAACRR
jgi:hypothetical protein